MKLDELRQSYDLILSVGANCQPAYQLNRLQFRKFSGLLDWVGTFSLPHLSLCIKKNFIDFMNYAHLQVVSSDPANPHYTVIDVINQISSIHDFPNNVPIDQSYPEVKAKFTRRAERFLNEISQRDSILFVRVLGDYEGIVDLRSALAAKVNGKFTILVINHHTENSIVEEDWGLDNVCSIKIPDDPARWQGLDYWWDEVFKGISLKE